jgi:hypothetical protein
LIHSTSTIECLRCYLLYKNQRTFTGFRGLMCCRAEKQTIRRRSRCVNGDRSRTAKENSGPVQEGEGVILLFSFAFLHSLVECTRLPCLASAAPSRSCWRTWSCSSESAVES